MPSSITPDPSAAENAAMQALSNMGIRCDIYADDACQEPGSRDCADCETRRRQFLNAIRNAGWAPCAETYRQAAADLMRVRSLYEPQQQVALDCEASRLRIKAEAAERGDDQ